MIAQAVRIEQGTGILFGMACAIVGLCLLLAYVVDDLIRTKAERAEDIYERAFDMRQTLMYDVGQIMVAERIRELARNYESTENVLLRKKIGRTEWREGGTPLPALWLMAVADEISPHFPCEFGNGDFAHEHTFAGECIKP